MKHPQVKDALQSEPPLHIPDTLASPELALVRSKLTQDGLARSLLVLPLGEAGRLTGWLVLSSAQAEQFTPLDYHVALLVAAHLSAAVQNLTVLRQLSAANARLREQETRLTWLNAQLELLDRTDDLTGLANRRHLMAQLESEFARSRRYGGDLSCLMIDVDGFKQVNDSHGHGGGDLVLKQLGALFRKATRTTDVFGRYGGDEFTLILPHTGTAGALCAAEKLRIAVREHGFTPNDRAPIPLTISVGAATCTDFSSSDAVRLLSLADTALYDAKRAGGDRVRQAGAPA
jgi:diguanylate cyclase (GGDEF)-like protein